MPVWRERDARPIAWFGNPNIQPGAEYQRRLESMRRYGSAAGLEVVVPQGSAMDEAWDRWRDAMGHLPGEQRCRACLTLRLDEAAAAAAQLGVARFSTTLSVSPYQRHDLIEEAGAAASARHGVEFVYADLRDRFRESYAESRRLELYRQPYCGCAASKWESWHQRRARRAR